MRICHSGLPHITHVDMNVIQLLIKIATWNPMLHLALMVTHGRLEYKPKVFKVASWPLQD